MPYQGIFAVEGDEFQLWADSLIVNADQVAFDFGSQWQGGNYPISNVATLQPDGSYDTGQIHYLEHWTGRWFPARIVFSRIEETEDGCQVEGKWHEEDGQSCFEGLLEPVEGPAA